MTFIVFLSGVMVAATVAKIIRSLSVFLSVTATNNTGQNVSLFSYRVYNGHVETEKWSQAASLEIEVYEEPV